VNIFVLDESPRVAAEYHCDKHVVKMIVETAQILSTTHHVLDGEEAVPGIYKKTHANHPCCVWARESSENYSWLLSLGFYLAGEYKTRYKKTHKTSQVLDTLSSFPSHLPSGSLTPFALAMPEQYVTEDAVQSYRGFYIGEKARFAKWKYTEAPAWFSHIS
jgi:hypothetical protein